MAVYERSMLLRCKDEAGNSYLLYPVTTLDCVDGAEDLLHYGKAQDLTDDEKAQALTNIGAIPTPSTAVVGQYIRVAAVDANGKITAIEAVDAPSGGGGSASVDGETLVVTGATVDGETMIM